MLRYVNCISLASKNIFPLQRSEFVIWTDTSEEGDDCQ